MCANVSSSLDLQAWSNTDPCQRIVGVLVLTNECGYVESTSVRLNRSLPCLIRFKELAQGFGARCEISAWYCCLCGSSDRQADNNFNWCCTTKCILTCKTNHCLQDSSSMFGVCADFWILHTSFFLTLRSDPPPIGVGNVNDSMTLVGMIFFHD